MSQAWVFNYTYLANSNLLSSVADTETGYTQTRTYEANRDLLDVIETKWSTATKAKFDYASDTLGRRTGVAKTGEMFTRYSAAGLDTTWGYNDRSELTSEVSKLGGTSTVLTGRNDAYSFDSIGNRATTAGTTHNGATAGYTTNALNQYTQRTVVGTVDVAGLAPAAATVNVNASSAGVTRHNDYYFKGLGVANTSSAVWSSLTIDSTFGGSSTRTSFTALTAEPFDYDLDGNLLSDGRWDYTYDAENRLVSMQTHSDTTAFPITPADARRIEFKNDYLGRRVQKTVLKRNAGNTAWETLSDTKSLYNGWNLICELDALNGFTKVRGYVWGLDWSGTLQGAGGVGGLINAHDYTTATSQRPAYDGNGNLMALLKSTDGTFTAAYEYDAFGNTLRATGTYAASNPFRFSTKYTDVETGLVYYGLRYYSPTLGRFINRDPTEESGGINLYRFVRNNSVNRIDPTGAPENFYYPGGYGSFNPYAGSGTGSGSGFSFGVGVTFGTTPTFYIPNVTRGPKPLSTVPGYPNIPADVGNSYFGANQANSSQNRFGIRALDGVSVTYQYDPAVGAYVPVKIAAPAATVTQATPPGLGAIGGDASMDDALKGFLFGTDNATRNYGADDAWTVAMRQHPHMSSIRGDIQEALASGDFAIGRSINGSFSLNSLSLLQNARILGTDALAALQIVGSEYSMGSFRLSYSVDSVTNSLASVTFRASDILRVGSATRIPGTSHNLLQILAAAGVAPTYSPTADQIEAMRRALNTNFDQPFGPNAPLNNVYLNWSWTEVFRVPGGVPDVEKPNRKGPPFKVIRMPDRP